MASTIQHAFLIIAIICWFLSSCAAVFGYFIPATPATNPYYGRSLAIPFIAVGLFFYGMAIYK